MSPKKKKKSNKLSRMTEDERLRYLQHRTAMEDEIQRRKQQLIATFLKTKLEHEEAFSRINSAEINQKWRHILRQIKCKELKENVLTLKERFEEVLGSKNKLIESLLRDFDTAEFQHSLQFQTHAETISKFLEVHQARLLSLSEWFTKQLREIFEQNKEIVLEVVAEFQTDLENLQLLCKKKQEESDNTLADMKTSFDNNKNELQTKWLYKIVKLEEQYADEINEMKQNYDAVIKKYKENTDTKYAHYKILEKKDDSDTVQIVDHFEQISKYTKKIKEAKIEYEELENKNRDEINRLKCEKRKLANELLVLQNQNTGNRNNDHNQLKSLVNISTNIIQELDEIAKKGDQIRHLADWCEKLRNKKESELPPISDPENCTDNIFSSPCEKLDQFQKMYVKNQTIDETLHKEKMLALEENKKLKKLLRFYMASVHRSSSVPRKCGL